jgi:HSP20 family protein
MLLVPSLLSSPRAFDAVVSQLFDAPQSTSAAPALDVEQTDAGYTVQIDMPGIAKADVKVTIDGKRVSVRAETATAQAEGRRVLWRERAARRFARSFSLPNELDQAASSAKLEDGVLTLTLAKKGASETPLAIN